MHPDLVPVIREATARDAHTAIATNGTLITERMARRLREVGLGYVEVSLDSPDPEAHDRFRRVKGTFERAVRGIENCVREGIFTSVAMTVTKVNMG